MVHLTKVLKTEGTSKNLPIIVKNYSEADIQDAWRASGRSGRILEVDIRARKSEVDIPPRYAFVSIAGSKGSKTRVPLMIREEIVLLEPHRKIRKRKA